MTKTILLDIETRPETPEALMILPKPVNDWLSRCHQTRIENITAFSEIEAINSQQHAYLITPSPQAIPNIQFQFIDNHGQSDPWIWSLEDNRHTVANTELIAFAKDITSHLDNPQDKIQALVEHAASYFNYAHPDARFNDGLENVPLLCGMAKGSCVDINTYLIAAAKAIGIKVQYMAGYWFHPDKTTTLDMHCWLAFDIEDNEKPIFWDVAHHLKWGVNPLKPGLNPAKGRRVPMSCGRGLKFDTPYGEINISHFSEPLWILPSGELIKATLKIHILEE